MPDEKRTCDSRECPAVMRSHDVGECYDVPVEVERFENRIVERRRREEESRGVRWAPFRDPAPGRVWD